MYTFCKKTTQSVVTLGFCHVYKSFSDPLIEIELVSQDVL